MRNPQIRWSWKGKWKVRLTLQRRRICPKFSFKKLVYVSIMRWMRIFFQGFIFLHLFISLIMTRRIKCEKVFSFSKIIEFISSIWYYLIYFFEHTYLVHHSPDSEKACSLSHTFPNLQTLSGLIHNQASTYSLCNKWLETHLVNTFNFTHTASMHLLQRDLFHRLNEWT